MVELIQSEATAKLREAEKLKAALSGGLQGVHPRKSGEHLFAVWTFSCILVSLG